MSNADRADAAQFALEWYADRKGEDPEIEGFETILRDLLTDLMHFCEREHINFYQNHKMALIHFAEEWKEEENG